MVGWGYVDSMFLRRPEAREQHDLGPRGMARKGPHEQRNKGAKATINAPYSGVTTKNTPLTPRTTSGWIHQNAPQMHQNAPDLYSVLRVFVANHTPVERSGDNDFSQQLSHAVPNRAEGCFAESPGPRNGAAGQSIKGTHGGACTAMCGTC